MVATPSPSDPRAKDLSLTAAGRELRELALRHRLGILAGATGEWEPKDRAELADLLARLAAGTHTSAETRAGSGAER